MERLTSHWSSTCVTTVFACHLATWLHLSRSFLPPYQHQPGPHTHPVTLANFDQGYYYPTCDTPSAISVILNSLLPYSFSAAANAHKSYDFLRPFSSMLRVLGPSALDISRLSLLYEYNGIQVLILICRRKAFYLFLLCPNSVMMAS